MRLIIFFAVLFFHKNILLAQEVSDISPAKYLKIYEQKVKDRRIKDIRYLDKRSDNSITDNKEAVRLLWEYPYKQLVNYVDDRSIIIIDFEKDSLIHNHEFVGNFSIKAKLNENMIEVPLYSMVGDALTKIGVEGVNSIRDFAASLLGLLIASNKILNSVEYQIKVNPTYISGYTKEDSIAIQKTIEEFSKLPKTLNNYEEKLSDFLGSNNASSRLYSFIYGDLHAIHFNDTMKFSEAEIMSTLKNILTEIKSELNMKGGEIYENNQPLVKYYKARYKELSLLKQYINYFTKSNDETFMSFSRAIERDPIFVRYISDEILTLDSSMRNKVKKLDEFNNSDEVSNSRYLRSMFQNMQNDIEAFENIINELHQINYDALRPIVPDTVFNPNSLKRTGERAKIFNGWDVKSDSVQLQEIDTLYILFAKRQVREFLIRYLTTEASKYIYKKLVSTTIDLQSLQPKEGDKLTIILVWKNAQGVSEVKEKDGKKIAEMDTPIATFIVRELGWRLRVPDSFFLVKRNEEDRADADLSPSRFKGAAGVSLLWSYTSDHTGTAFGRIFRFFEPSIGINVSYLDFSTVKDVEIGLGGIIGLFRNKIFLTIGRNLNIPDKAIYYGLGFSFGNLGAEIKKMHNKD